MQTAILEHARDMRRHPTPAERTLWNALRGRQLRGLKFARQVPIARYIVDFFCHKAQLVIEVDGDTHADTTNDTQRDQWMHDHGLRVQRFSNRDVTQNLEGVLTIIQHLVEATPPPCPLPQGRGIAYGDGASGAA